MTQDKVLELITGAVNAMADRIQCGKYGHLTPQELLTAMIQAGTLPSCAAATIKQKVIETATIAQAEVRKKEQQA